MINDFHLVTSLLTPLFLGLLFHGLCMKFGWLSQLAMPIDRGHTFRGRRVLGPNKTYRGIVAVGVGTAVGFALRPFLGGAGAPPLEAEWLNRPGIASTVFGFCVGAAAMVAELPNSFIKRQLNIGAGQAGRGVLGFVFYFVDQVDMLPGVWLVLSLVTAIKPGPVAWSVVVLFVAHQVFTVAGYGLGLRSAWR